MDKKIRWWSYGTLNTVSDSVSAAIKIQNESHAKDNFHFTIGINIGEMVFENKVFGDAVNSAARKQTLSIPRSIYLSEAIHNNISNK